MEIEWCDFRYWKILGSSCNVNIMALRWIYKIGLAVVEDGRLLVVRKRETEMFILPGGKPEGNETDLEALHREIEEELGCSICNPQPIGLFRDLAAGMNDAAVAVRLYKGRLEGEPRAQAEIVELDWISLSGKPVQKLAPSLLSGILPHLRKLNRSGSGNISEDLFQA